MQRPASCLQAPGLPRSEGKGTLVCGAPLAAPVDLVESQESCQCGNVTGLGKNGTEEEVSPSPSCCARMFLN